eukprot:TRINITY_DN8000_c0_g1_i1.p1 TRINITY_DN8000_c0_g1~~TRINITY_DN8000_c0_g1_i1.p1  ORF type:complete len:309 (+),score=66.01 TRINITY_DN8000_c0_g1_i1:124-1050(+)
MCIRDRSGVEAAAAIRLLKDLALVKVRVAVLSDSEEGAHCMKVLANAYAIEAVSLEDQHQLIPVILPAHCSAPREGRWTGEEASWTAVVVLGNQPLDSATPTVDCVQRVLHAVGLYKQLAQDPSRAVRVICTGGTRTTVKAGRAFPEARMMALIAMAEGVPATSILLEDAALSTAENAELTARLLVDEGFETAQMRERRQRASLAKGKGRRGVKGKGKWLPARPVCGGAARRRLLSEVVVVSNSKHIEWALPMFTQVEMLRGATGSGVDVDPALLEAQVELFLESDPCYGVRMRLQNIRDRVPGVDAM